MTASLIRAESESDFEDIRALHLRAFGEDSVGTLIDDLRNESVTQISLVCERDGQIVGHVLFSRIEAGFRALTMAPVGVCPSAQKSGIGSSLIRQGLDQAAAEGWQIVFVLGDPAYYERFGFNAATAQGYSGPYSGPDNMALLLDKNAPESGEVRFPAAFDEDIVEHQARELKRKRQLKES